MFEELGATPRDLVKLLTIVAGADHLPGFYAAREEVFADRYPDGDVPAHSHRGGVAPRRGETPRCAPRRPAPASGQ
ncbi:hypothetical protein DP939_20965 [Spongiactinospora rosea]|uniref:Uncharacterized protein n=1 Tax=Spongiactinospora rosea TaxID=2248750 RepID=A0A366LXP7_9ACTN|nr:RidA family protein [Spongiactinospora rosea]RBQ18340.1 hypothetical protein DP939_20965 [Spongiactinospora rosea]